jgi:hypothetical protein
VCCFSTSEIIFILGKYYILMNFTACFAETKGDKTKNDWMLGPMARTGERRNRFGNVTLWRCDYDEMTILKWILDK